MKFQIGKSNRKSFAHSHRTTTSTTCDFSFVQPIFSRFLMAGSKINGKIGQFLRLAPMPWPTFGECKLKTLSTFVPIEYVFPQFAALMAQKEYVNTNGDVYYPQKMPYMRISELFEYLLNNYTNKVVYTTSGNLVGSVTDDIKISDMQVVPLEALYDAYKRERDNGANLTFRTPVSVILLGEVPYKFTRQQLNTFAKVYNNSIKIDDAYNELAWPKATNAISDDDMLNIINSSDYVSIGGSEMTPTTTQVVTTYKYQKRGEALRKVLIGLGYNLTLDDDTMVNILPLIAFHKAYYDYFYPSNLDDWQTSKAYSLVKYIEEHNIEDVNADDESIGKFQSFFDDELTQLFSSNELDFVSSHMANPANNQNPFISQPTSYRANIGKTEQPVIKSSSDPNNQTSEGMAGANPSIDVTSSNPLTHWSVQWLSALQRYVNRDSVIGNRLEMWCKNHLDSDVYNQLYHTSRVVSTFDIDVQISDVNSTADTLGTQGSELGSYAGKGIGSGSNTFKCEANTYGFFFIMAWIAPTTGYYQGTDARLFALDKWQLPTSEFDALGYEATPRSFLWTDNGISLRDYITGDHSMGHPYVDSDDGFGMMPRYSSWKYVKNIVNGDLSRLSMRNSYAPFFLDRMLVCRSLEAAKGAPDKVNYLKVKRNPLPLASSIWRYVSKASFLSNYNRIFYNSGSLDAQNDDVVDDNFILHCVIDFTEVNSLKPLSISLDTSSDGGDDMVTFK